MGTFSFAGVAINQYTYPSADENCGGQTIEADILVVQIVDEAPSGKPIVAGHIRLGIIDLDVIDSVGCSLYDVTDNDFHAWGNLVTPENYDMWQSVFPSLAMSEVHHFICVEEAFVKPEWRGHGLFEHALGSLLRLVRFGHESVLLIMANPWHFKGEAQLRTHNFDRDQSNLVKFYRSLGFKRVCQDKKAVVMGTSGMIRNKTLDSLFSRCASILDFEASAA